MWMGISKPEEFYVHLDIENWQEDPKTATNFLWIQIWTGARTRNMY